MLCWIGTDESGKGDYFGGLVVAGVMVNEYIIPKLSELGVKDSKKISDTRIKSLSEAIQKLCPYSIVMIGPEKYNELYSKMHNLNYILAWGHARVIENMLEKVDCKLAIADKFGDRKYIERALMKKGKQIKLEQRPKAEDDPAVAAASILARAKFVEELEKLSAQIPNYTGQELPKGASAEVERVAKDLVDRYGDNILQKVAKLHFKTTMKVTQPFRVDTIQSQRQENYKVSLERLWAPWRTKYIYLSSKDRCIFCEAIAKKDAEAYVLSREAKAFVVMNIFPYNNGHLMIAPYRHVGVIGELTSEEVISMFKLVQESVRVLEFTMNPDGFNIGINVGTVAGAGVRDHIHIHVVPRWVGDTNFMPVISETKVICQSLKEGYKLLKEAFGKC